MLFNIGTSIVTVKEEVLVASQVQDCGRLAITPAESLSPGQNNLA